MAKKITMTGIRKSLKDQEFRLGFRDQAWFIRSADIAPGLGVVEHKHNSRGLGIENTFTVTAYQGHAAPQHWESINRVTLKEAVAWANEHAAVAKEHWESEE